MFPSVRAGRLGKMIRPVEQRAGAGMAELTGGVRLLVWDFSCITLMILVSSLLEQTGTELHRTNLYRITLYGENHKSAVPSLAIHSAKY